jgi:MtfA peptidase
MQAWLEFLWPQRLTHRRAVRNGQTEAIWQTVLQQFPFLAQLDEESQNRLRALSLRFLQQKEFHGTQGLQITDTMAMSVAAQACLPILNIAPPREALTWYDDFVGIVIHPAEMLAHREIADEDGVVHHYDEELAGEAMERGPVTLNWKDVANAGAAASLGTNLVIHEFAHKLDMRSGVADACPPLPKDFLGSASDRQARQCWIAAIHEAFETFREQTILAERFGQPKPWLDPYAAQSLPEFFAVACEAYFVNRTGFDANFPKLTPVFDAFFDRRH